jgi:hypothetical protein
MTEAELFAAYRVAAGYAAQCACGAWITAPSSAAPLEIGQRVRVHNESTEHSTFFAERAAVDALRKPVHVHCSCHGGQP